MRPSAHHLWAKARSPSVTAGRKVNSRLSDHLVRTDQQIRKLTLRIDLYRNLVATERGVYFATYRGSFVGPEPALDNDAGAIAA